MSAALGGRLRAKLSLPTTTLPPPACPSTAGRKENCGSMTLLSCSARERQTMTFNFSIKLIDPLIHSLHSIC